MAVYAKSKTDKVDDFFSKDYIEHEPTIGAVRAGLVTAVKASAKQQPQIVPTIKQQCSPAGTSPCSTATGRPAPVT